MPPLTRRIDGYEVLEQNKPKTKKNCNCAIGPGSILRGAGARVLCYNFSSEQVSVVVGFFFFFEKNTKGMLSRSLAHSLATVAQMVCPKLFDLFEEEHQRYMLAICFWVARSCAAA